MVTRRQRIPRSRPKAAALCGQYLRSAADRRTVTTGRCGVARALETRLSQQSPRPGCVTIVAFGASIRALLGFTASCAFTANGHRGRTAVCLRRFCSAAAIELRCGPAPGFGIIRHASFGSAQLMSMMLLRGHLCGHGSPGDKVRRRAPTSAASRPPAFPTTVDRTAHRGFWR